MRLKLDENLGRSVAEKEPLRLAVIEPFHEGTEFRVRSPIS